LAAILIAPAVWVGFFRGPVLTNPQSISVRRRWRAIGLLLVGTFFVSLISVFASLAYRGGAAPLTLVLARSGTLVLVLGLILGLSRGSLRLPRRNFRATFWISICLLMMSVGYLGSVAFINVNIAVLLLYTYPLLVAVFSILSGRERVSMARGALLVLAFLGLVIALGKDIGLDLGPAGMAVDPSELSLDPRGVALALTASLGLAVFITWGGPSIEGADAKAMNLWPNLWIVGMVAAYLLAMGGFSLPRTGLGWIGFVGAVGCYVMAMLCWFKAMPLLTPTETAMTLNLEPAISFVAASLVLGEESSLQRWIGTIILLIAIGFSTWMANRQAAESRFS
jgi:drug/metabolite transporter (DMT)-like permease